MPADSKSEVELATLHKELEGGNPNQNRTQKTDKITVGNYLFDRLAQLGVKSVFGVAGDFNFNILDVIEDHPRLDFVANCNELNAAYAADGYARMKENSLGVLVTTFGVGELSATNGIAGAYSEIVPVLHIVGVPSTAQRKKQPLLHHTLGNGKYDAYKEMAKHITAKVTDILDVSDAAQQIDEAIATCVIKARPVYLMLPTDIVQQEIPAQLLQKPLDITPPPNAAEKQQAVIDTVHDLVTKAQGDVVVIVDACVIRHHVRNEVKEFLKATGFPVYATPMGKTAIDENNPRYGGIYVGSITPPHIKEKVENARLIITIGSLGSDFNTGYFSYNIPQSRSIELHSDYTQIQYATFEGIGMKEVLPRLAEKLSSFSQVAGAIEVPRLNTSVPEETSSEITHAWFWRRLGHFFRPQDIIVTETGTANFGILDVLLPEKSVLINQILWGSIGWSVGATFGAAMAARELGLERVLLFVGDGSLQLSVQEISSIIRNGLKPIIFVINNHGYTIERCIHGKHRHYNDIAEWDWQNLLATFNDKKHFETASYRASDKDSLSKILDDSTFASTKKVQLVEVVMNALDAPQALQKQVQASSG